MPRPRESWSIFRINSGAVERPAGVHKRRRFFSTSNPHTSVKRILRLHWLAVVFAAALWPEALRAGLSVVADSASVTVGGTVTVRASGVPAGAEVDWSSTWELRLVSAAGGSAEFAAVVPGPGVVSVAAGGEWGTAKVTVAPRPDAKRPSIPAVGRVGVGGAFAVGDLKRMQDLLERYRRRLESARLHTPFMPGSPEAEATPVNLEAGDSRRLTMLTEQFCKELGGAGFSLRDLQRYKDNFNAAANGGTPLFPGGDSWGRTFQGTERALMMGRATLVQQLWKETLIETLRANPKAGVFGEIDIGSWVKLQLGGLGFAADIDFSSVATDGASALNRQVRDRFEAKLREHTSLDMIQADALLTAHGQATPDVFIGEWGKTFAELDMLKRSKWKILRPKIENGVVVDVEAVERRGADLFWEVAFQNAKPVNHPVPEAEYRSGAMAGPEADFPKMGLDKEPMLSLEMYRHGIHDIEHGPFSRGQQLIKMLKYAERSYFMNKKAVAGTGWNPYESNDPVFAQAAADVIKNKDNPAAVDELLRGLAGVEITEANVDAVTQQLMARAKIAMHDNATRALGFRLKGIAAIENEDARRAAAEKMWADLDTELKAFEHGVQKPQLMVDALELTKAVAEGKVSAEELEQKSADLEKLLTDSLKLSKEVVERTWVGDTYAKLRSYLSKKLRWPADKVDAFCREARKKFPNGAKVLEGVTRFNDQLARTAPGQGLLDAADFADTAFTVYDAYLSSADPNEALWNASIAMGRAGAQRAFPSLGLPFAFYDSYQEGSPRPLGMAVTFMYFPWIGQTYMVSGMLQRLDGTMRDGEFYGALDKMMAVTDFDPNTGRLVRFRLLNKFTVIVGGKATEIDSADIDQGNREQIVALFTAGDSPFYVSPNFRYFASLVPKHNDQFGRYENKLDNLRRFFPYNADVRDLSEMLRQFRATPPKNLADAEAAKREALLDDMEQALQRAVWVAMADALESAYREVKRPELDAKIKKLEDDFSLGDHTLGDGKGLRAKIAGEIRQNSSVWTGENAYAVTLIYDRYTKAYDRVAAIQKAITMDVWYKGFEADSVAAQQKPLRLFFQGGDRGAPSLSGEPEKDVALAEAALAAHKKRAAQVREDLAKTLGRAIDLAKDKEHLRALGQLALEGEHLLDEAPTRTFDGLSEASQNLVLERGRAYNAYLEKLGAVGKAGVTIQGPTEATQGQAVTFAAALQGVPEEKAKLVRFLWRLGMQPDGTLGTGPTVTFKPEKSGEQTVFVRAIGKKPDGSEENVGFAQAMLAVNPGSQARAEIKGPTLLKVGGKGRYYVELNAESIPWGSLRMEWTNAVLSGATDAELTPTAPGKVDVKVVVFAKFGGKEVKFAEATLSVLVTDNAIKMPAAVDAAQIFNASIEVPAELAKQVATYHWYTGAVFYEDRKLWEEYGPPLNVTSVQAQYYLRGPMKNPDDPIPPQRAAVELRDAKGKTLMTYETQVVVRPATFGAVATDIWEGGSNSEAVWLTRKPSKSAQLTDENGRVYSSASAWGAIKVRATTSEKLQTIEGIAEELRREVEEYKQDLVPLSFDGFQGLAAQTKQVNWSSGGGGPDSGYTHSGAERKAHGFVAKGRIVLEVSYHAGASGSFDNSDRAWLIAKVDEIFGEAKGIVASLALKAGGKVEQKPYKGPALDGSDEVQPIAVTVDGPATVRFGQTGTVTAKVTGSRGPFTYEWSGDHAGKGASVTVLPTKAGDQKLTVSVTGGDTQKASATFTYKVEKVSATITGLEGAVVYGTERKIAVKTNVEAKALKVIWQSEPNVTFTPAVSTDGAATVRIDRMPPGGLKIWAQLASAADGGTIGETTQVQVKVAGPKLSLEFEPKAARIGQEVTARVVANPEPVDPALLTFQWAEPVSAQRRELDAAARSIAFVPRDTKPVSLLVRALVPTVAERVGEATAKFTATGYKLSAKVVEPGTRPMIWKEGVGLVPVAKGRYAGDELVTVEAKFEGEEPTGDIKWGWSVNDGTSVTNPASRTPQLSRHETGTASATVVARGKDDLLLGTATVSFSVNVTADAVKQAQQPKVTLKADRQSPQTGDTITFTAEVRGGKSPYTYKWGGAGLTGNGVTATAKPTAAGSLRADVAVSDSAGKTDVANLELEVKLSARDKARQDAERAVARAKELAAGGDFEGATRLIDEARKNDPAVAAPVAAEIAQAAKARADEAEKRRDFEASGKLFTAATKLAPQDVEAVRGKNNAPVYQERVQVLRSCQTETDRALNEGDFARADDKLKIATMMEDLLPGARSPETEVLVKRYDVLIAAYQRDIAAFKKSVAQQLADNQLAKARTRVEDRMQHPLLPEDRTWAEATLQVITDKEVRAAAAAVANRPPEPSTSATKVPPVAGGSSASESPETVRGPMPAPGKDEQGPSSAGTPPLTLVGTWKADFNGYRGTFTYDGRTAILDIGQGRETLRDVRFDATTGKVSFIRPLPQYGADAHQFYTGRLAPDGTASGFFDRTATFDGYGWWMASATETPVAAPVAPAEKLETLFTNWNVGGVNNGPTAATTFTLRRAARVTYVNSYHFNFGRGSRLGTLTLQHSDGTTYGPWKVRGSVASGSPNGLWEVDVDLVLAPGVYTVIDSDPATWAQNGQSGGRGFVEIRGVWLDGKVVPTPGSKPPAQHEPAAPAAGDLPAGVSGARLLAYYPLHGDARDASGNNRHGKLNELTATRDRLGRVGGALFFQGRGYVDVPVDINPSVTPELTLAAWACWNDSGVSIQQVLSHDNGDYGRSLGIDSRSEKPGWAFFTGDGPHGAAPAANGRWVFLAAVWNAKTGRGRLQVDDQVFEHPVSNGGGFSTLRIGGNPRFGEAFTGAISDVWVFGRALSRAEIAALRASAAKPLSTISGVAPEAVSPAPSAEGRADVRSGLTGKPKDTPQRATPPVGPTAAQVKYVQGFAGDWDSNWGRMSITVNGVKIQASYTHDDGRIEATLSPDGRTLTGTWTEAPTRQPPRDFGQVTITLSPDGQTLSGKWGFGDTCDAGDWTGTKIRPAAPAAAQPAGPPAAEANVKPAVRVTGSQPQAAMIEGILENRSNQNVHIIVEGRDTFGPQNRLTPGQKRTISVEVPASGKLRFVAGRNGQVLASGNWAGDPSDLSRYPVVRFTEDGGARLLVTTGLK